MERSPVETPVSSADGVLSLLVITMEVESSDFCATAAAGISGAVSSSDMLDRADGRKIVNAEP